MKWYKKQLTEILKKKEGEKGPVKTKVNPTSHAGLSAMKTKQGRVSASPVKQRNNNRSKTDCK